MTVALVLAAQPDAEVFIHPECGCATPALWQWGTGDLPRARVLSTGGMLTQARSVPAGSVLVATETGMLHQLRQANPAVRWEPVHEGAVCRYMKMITPAALLRCLRDGVDEVTLDPGVAARARRTGRKPSTATAPTSKSAATPIRCSSAIWRWRARRSRRATGSRRRISISTPSIISA